VSQQQLQVLFEISRDLTTALAAEDRYARLLAAVRKIIPFDAACLLRRDGDELVPLAGIGLRAGALTRRYSRHDHPRLDLILNAAGPVTFDPDSPLADPFDGELEVDPAALRHIHACFGCPLTEGDTVVGALTADALDPRAFAALDLSFLAALGALAGAAVRTSSLIEALERRVSHRGQVARDLQRAAAESSGGALLGPSVTLRRLRDEIALVARSDLAVLISGETGVGKELVAHEIHAASPRADEALIHVNCAALPLSIAESELFGHVAGAFTGATRDRAGKFEVANGGTLLLDEVGELPIELQPKLLRALQQGEIQRVGSDRTHRVNVRVIAATNRLLSREVEKGRFRADLYHRLAVFPIRVPPLRERREDIPVLAAHFADLTRRRLGIARVTLADEARLRLVEAAWPGNVRELENVVSRAVLRAASVAGDGAEVVEVAASHLDVQSATPVLAAETGHGPVHLPAAPAPLRDRLMEFQRRAILMAVERHGGNWAAAARELGLNRANLHHLAGRLGIGGKRRKPGASSK
jgi:anaerobic nitric oxide reductase transcription regulator